MADEFAEALLESLDADVTQQLLDEFRQGRLMEAVQARERLRLAAAAGGERRQLPCGEVRFAIDPFYYHAFGRKYGYDCWADKDFVADTMRKSPETRVRSRSDRIMVGGGGVASGATRRFHKSYGEI